MYQLIFLLKILQLISGAPRKKGAPSIYGYSVFTIVKSLPDCLNYGIRFLYLTLVKIRSAPKNYPQIQFPVNTTPNRTSIFPHVNLPDFIRT